jgi:hypothetical protein
MKAILREINNNNNNNNPGSKGCKDQLLIPKTMFEDCNKRKKELNLAWIDY